MEKKLSESIGKPKDLWKALKSLGLPNKISSCEVSALKINNTVEHDANSCFHFNLASVSENSILTISKSTQVSKAAGLDGLFGSFLNVGAKSLA